MANLSGSRWAPASHRDVQPINAGIRPSSPSVGTTTVTTSDATQRQRQLSKPQRDLLSRHSSLQKFHLLLRRLKWKSRSLLYAHHRALHERDVTMVGEVGFALEPGEADTMFKIDFFEFYVLLERVLVCLLGGLGMVVTPAAVANTSGSNAKPANLDNAATGRAAPPIADTNAVATNGELPPKRSLREELMEQHRQRQGQQPKSSGQLGDSTMFHGYAHRFHANVLAALDLPSNPLHDILGTSPVRDYLGIAKEFRNRWKDADENPPPAPTMTTTKADGQQTTDEQRQKDRPFVGSRYEKMLADLRLEHMLEAILVAIETARPVAAADLDRFANTVTSDSATGSEAVMTTMMEDMEWDDGTLPGAGSDAPWEAMPDAMDWS